MKFNYFKEINFLTAIKVLFKELNVPVNYISDEPTTAKEILEYTYKDNETFKLIEDVYFVGMVDDAAFEGNESFNHKKIKSDYDGILFFGVELNKRENNLLPTRTQLADIARAFNREFHFTPVVIVFKYANDKESFISFANTERIKYKQEWREGEKAGKVSLLRDISIEKPHRGHEDIINELRITTSGKKAIRSFDALYKYWQEVFSVNILNKKFYQELSNWYFWAIKNVTFPSEPTLDDVIKKYGQPDHDKLAELINEHNAINVIRLLTRLLFTWFIKEKKLIPESLFDLDVLQDEILKDIKPYQQEGMFKHASKDSIYYKAILQNLFFASLNCPIEADAVDKRKRGFRGNGYATHRGIDYLMRYKKQFKNPDAFLKLMNETVPFLNGGLFECLDDKYQNIYIDGFSDQMTQGQQLIVPDFLFFGLDTEVDLSQDYGSKNKKYKKAAVKGLINILKSFKFTITENTPIEEDVALDPELLGKVFENLLASYNPETKSTARKQTGSFYTPREIVNYMVDESLIAYLKNSIDDWGIDEEGLDKKLHELTSFDPINPFEENISLSTSIIKSLDQCKILDPACGSGAFPMGILQKMVHILQKLDPTNEHWKEVQLEKAILAYKEAYDIEDKHERENKLIEINNVFDSNINDPDYARKLYLIENCIYGVDIQPIATQISKLRFFISLVVNQKKNDKADNFGIRALPNLETKFVTANTLIGIDKDTSLFYTDEIRQLEEELKHVRHRIFSLKSKERQVAWRLKDKELREKMTTLLTEKGMPLEESEKLASWDPYDQNTSASFYDSEWMFDIREGFNVVIGNPPYFVYEGSIKSELKTLRSINLYEHAFNGKLNAYKLFILKSYSLLHENGVFSEIFQNSFLADNSAVGVRKYFLKQSKIISIDSFSERDNSSKRVFPGVKMSVCILLALKKKVTNYSFNLNVWESRDMKKGFTTNFTPNEIKEMFPAKWDIPTLQENEKQIFNIFYSHNPLNLFFTCYQGELNMSSHREYFTSVPNDHMALKGAQIQQYEVLINGMSQGQIEFVDINKYKKRFSSPKSRHHEKDRIAMQGITGVNESIRLKAAFVKKGFFCAHSCNYLVSTNLNSLWSVLLLLNSKLFNWIFKKTSTNSNVNSYEIQNLTIPKLPTNIDQVSILLSKILSFNRSQVIHNVSDALVYNLYFPDHMKVKEIDVIEYVEQDIQKAFQGRAFDSLSDSEKEEVIEQLQATWTHPDNEVRNRMKLFAVRSPDILKPILES